MDLPQQHLEHVLGASIRRATFLDPGYPNSNAVWRVDTDAAPYICKLCGHESGQPQSCFWLGMQELFGAHPADELADQPALAAWLQHHSPLTVPQVVHVEPKSAGGHRPFVVYAWLSGAAPRHRDYFASRPKQAYHLGRHIGSLHAQSHALWGNGPQTASFSPHLFAPRLVAAMRRIVRFGWQHDDEVRQACDAYAIQAQSLPELTHMSLIMPDISPSQFLCHNDALTAVIDLESFVRGPRELELVAIEMFVGQGNAFRDGYESACGPMPSLAAVREVFRFFFYVLYDAPPRDLQRWMNAPILFS